jgi:hypothetical protein
VSVRYCGRDFTEEDLELIRSLAIELPTRTAIAEAACLALGWLRHDERTAAMSARVALLRMATDGLVVLASPRNGNANGAIPARMETTSELPIGVPTTLPELGRIELVRVETKASSIRWRTLIATHHYLGYTPFAGAQLRYLVESGHGTIGALGFAASAWACAPRDVHIGWDGPTRKARLHLVVGNARFLILPNVTVPNLASHILGSVSRRLGSDWQDAYGYQPVLLETFVETGRFTGASYRAANCLHVGVTKGRGKLDRYNEHALPVKDVYLYPLQRNYQHILAAPA